MPFKKADPRFPGFNELRRLQKEAAEKAKLGTARRDENGKIISVERVNGVLKVVRLKRFWEFLQKAQQEKKRTVVVYGGGRSGKSYSIRQWILDQAVRHQEVGLRILVVMGTRRSVKNAAWDPMLEMVREYDIPSFKHETNLDIKIGNSEIQFRGLDDPEKVKSQEFNIIWCEEATSLHYPDFLQLKVRLSRPGPIPNQMVLSFNPISSTNWCMEKVVQVAGSDKDVCVMQSTYQDNPFLDQEYIDSLEALKDANYNMWLVYAKGEPGILDKIIYTNWDIVDWLQTPLGIRDRRNDPDSYGYDYGYTHPLSLCSYWEYEGEDYILEMVYKEKMDTEVLMAKMVELGTNMSTELFCPPEQPGVIALLCSRGYNAKPVPSECRNVKDGIDYCKGRKLHIISPSDNYIKEIQGYSYKEKKDGTVLEEPVKFKDDGMDAMRYARASLRGRYQGFKAGSSSKGDNLTIAMEEAICQREAENPMYR